MLRFCVIQAILIVTLCCTLQDQRWFLTKHLNTPFPIIPNPYLNPTADYLDKVNTSLHDKHSVCTVHYLDPSNLTY
jgi:hypothetical protein